MLILFPSAIADCQSYEENAIKLKLTIGLILRACVSDENVAWVVLYVHRNIKRPKNTIIRTTVENQNSKWFEKTVIVVEWLFWIKQTDETSVAVFLSVINRMKRYIFICKDQFNLTTADRLILFDMILDNPNFYVQVLIGFELFL